MSGITAATISILLIYLKRQYKKSIENKEEKIA
jgi:hypothetical protein